MHALNHIPSKAVITSLSCEVRVNLPTAEAAAHLDRSPQTLRCWAAFENGPLRPIRIGGRLAWPVADLRRVLAGDF